MFLTKLLYLLNILLLHACVEGFGNDISHYRAEKDREIFLYSILLTLSNLHIKVP